MTTQITPNLINAPLGTKNVIINGNFDVWQRGTTFAAIANGTFSSDRIEYNKAGTMVHTVSQSTDVPTYAQSGIKSNYSVKVDCTTAVSMISTDFTFTTYNVEGYDYALIAGGDATLSFWVKGTKTGIHCVAFRNVAFDRTYVSEYTINTTDTWEKKTITVPLTETGGTWDYTNGVGLRIAFVLAVGTIGYTTADAWQTGNYKATSNQVNACDSTANNFYLAQVQLEKGSTATDFEFRHVSDELTKCQRYYEKSYDPAAAPGTVTTFGALYIPATRNAATLQNGFFFATRKRDAASVSIYHPVSGTVSALDNGGVSRTAGAIGASTSGIRYITITSGTTSYISYQWTADAEL